VGQFLGGRSKPFSGATAAVFITILASPEAAKAETKAETGNAGARFRLRLSCWTWLRRHWCTGWRRTGNADESVTISINMMRIGVIAPVNAETGGTPANRPSRDRLSSCRVDPGAIWLFDESVTISINMIKIGVIAPVNAETGGTPANRPGRDRLSSCRINPTRVCRNFACGKCKCRLA